MYLYLLHNVSKDKKINGVKPASRSHFSEMLVQKALRD